MERFYCIPTSFQGVGMERFYCIPTSFQGVGMERFYCIPHFRVLEWRSSTVYLISGCWNGEVLLYTYLISGCWNGEVLLYTSFQGVGIERFYCIPHFRVLEWRGSTVYLPHFRVLEWRGSTVYLISGCWNGEVLLYTSFQGVGMERFYCIPHFRVLEWRGSTVYLPHFRVLEWRGSTVYLISGCWNREVLLYTSFQGVGMERFYCIPTSFQGVGMERFYCIPTSFQGVGMERFYCIPHFRVLEWRGSTVYLPHFRVLEWRGSTVYLISGCWNGQVLLYTSFQGVGIERFYCIPHFRVRFYISGGWNKRGSTVLQRCPYFRIEEFHCIQRCPYFRGWNREVPLYL